MTISDQAMSDLANLRFDRIDDQRAASIHRALDSDPGQFIAQLGRHLLAQEQHEARLTAASRARKAQKDRAEVRREQRAVAAVRAAACPDCFATHPGECY